mgnify:CR=1 FL=1
MFQYDKEVSSIELKLRPNADLSKTKKQIGDILGKTGRKLYYYERDSKLEIDFVIRYNKQAVAVEVKSADNTKAKSLDSLLKSGQVKQGIKLSSKNVGGTEQIDSYPLYMAMFL